MFVAHDAINAKLKWNVISSNETKLQYGDSHPYGRVNYADAEILPLGVVCGVSES